MKSEVLCIETFVKIVAQILARRLTPKSTHVTAENPEKIVFSGGDLGQFLIWPSGLCRRLHGERARVRILWPANIFLAFRSR